MFDSFTKDTIRLNHRRELLNSFAINAAATTVVSGGVGAVFGLMGMPPSHGSEVFGGALKVLFDRLYYDDLNNNDPAGSSVSARIAGPIIAGAACRAGVMIGNFLAPLIR